MGIENITSKIIDDAQAAAEETLGAARAARDEILTDASKQAEKIKSDAQARGRQDKEKLVVRRKSVAEIDGRKILLEQKQKLIGQCFDEAVERIVSLDRASYLDFLVMVARNTGLQEGELIFNREDAGTVGPLLIEKLRQEMPDSRFQVAEEHRKIKGGFLLKKDQVYINGTVEALVNEARDDLIGQVADLLFE